MGNEKIAWIDAEKGRYEIRLPESASTSPIIELIERIYFSESLKVVSRARILLRHRIFADYTPSAREQETVKVVAKRLSAPVDYAPSPWPEVKLLALPESQDLPSIEFLFPELELGSVIRKDEIPAHLERLKAKSHRASERWRSDRAVSAMLLDSQNRLLAFAWNGNAVVKTRHAESLLCSQLPTLAEGGKLPVNSRIYVSLKPCRMCAAHIWEAAVDPTQIEVIYLENDPGPLAQGTLLDSHSPARTRYLGPDSALLQAKILHPYSQF